MTETPLLQSPFVVQFEEDFHNPQWFKDNHIKMIMGQWVYDANKPVHCCEVTPSYELNFVRWEVIYEDGYDPTDEHIEKVENELSENSEQFCYVHCSTIERITLIDHIERHPHDKSWRVRWMSDEEIETLDPDENHIEDAVEYLNANHY